jgi:hypothetical protein
LSSSEFPDQALSSTLDPDSSSHPDDEGGGASGNLDATRRDREGLPRGFRMRHDAHFVEQLDNVVADTVVRMLPLARIDAPACDDGPQLQALAASIRHTGMIEPLVVRRRGARYQLLAGVKRFSAARLAQIDPVPCVVRDDLAEDAMLAWRASAPGVVSRVGEHTGETAWPTSRERGLDDALESLGAARSAIELVPPASRDLRSRTLLDVVRAELLAARHTLTAMRVLSALSQVRRVPAHPRDLLDEAVEAMAPIVRLAGARVAVTSDPALPAIMVMQPAAVFALECCLHAVVNLAGDARQPSIAIEARAGAIEPEVVAFNFHLDGGWLPQDAARRLTDVYWSQHPGGVRTALICSAAEAVAKAHAGGLQFTTSCDGFSIMLTYREK